MQHKLTLAVLISLSACSSMESALMPDTLLNVQVTCIDSPQCIFIGKDMPINIRISNAHDRMIGFPVAFRQKTGPYIRLIDSLNKTEKQLKTNLASLDLREQFTAIAPGDAININWVITSGELQQFATSKVDVTAEINITADVQIDGKKVPFEGVTKIRILDKTNR